MSSSSTSGTWGTLPVSTRSWSRSFWKALTRRVSQVCQYLTVSVKPSPMSGKSLQVYTLFDSVPELVDYVFALDVFYTSFSPYPDRDIFDRRVRMLAAEIAGRAAYVFGPTEDHRMLLPWQGGSAKEDYLDRRSTGAYYEAVKSLSAEWIDPANPDGGREVDAVALAQDQAATNLELVEGTITMAGDGGVVYYGTTEGIGQQVLFSTRSDCSGDSCNENSTYSNNPVPILLHSNSRSQNDGEIDRNTTVKDERRILVTDGTKTWTARMFSLKWSTSSTWPRADPARRGIVMPSRAVIPGCTRKTPAPTSSASAWC